MAHGTSLISSLVSDLHVTGRLLVIVHEFVFYLD